MSYDFQICVFHHGKNTQNYDGMSEEELRSSQLNEKKTNENF